MSGAVDHAFADELRTGWGYDSNGLGKDLGDLAGAVRAVAKLGHGAQVALFGWRQTIEAGTKETGIQFRRGLASGGLDVCCRDR